MWSLVPATVAVSGQTGLSAAQLASRSRGVVLVDVTAGKPSELHFALSKHSTLSAGTVTFNVRNAGKTLHDFKVCTAPLTGPASTNACAGKATKMLRPGQKTTLTIALTKSGTYEYLCSVPGHAAAGMRGHLTVSPPSTATPAAAVMTTPAATSPTTPPPAGADQTPPASNGFMGGGGG